MLENPEIKMTKFNYRLTGNREREKKNIWENGTSAHA